MAQTDEIIKSQFGNITNLKALQSQINPHFLYNTLDSLRGELYMCDMPNLAQMVETLSELFRYSISQKEPLISLEAEIDNTEKYEYDFLNAIFGEVPRFRINLGNKD